MFDVAVHSNAAFLQRKNSGMSFNVREVIRPTIDKKHQRKDWRFYSLDVWFSACNVFTVLHNSDCDVASYPTLF